jgi:hypothetical protein
MMNLDYRAITGVERRSGFVYIQPQPYGASGTGVPYEAVPPFGLMGRPRGPTSAGAPCGLVFRDGPEGFVVATTDPRYQDLLPDTGEGGAGLYACIEQSGTKKTPHVAVYGAGGDAPEGTVQIVCRSSAGDSTMTWDPSTGDVTIAHPGGTKINVKASGVELGADGGQAVALALPITAWAATVEARLATLGQSGTAPAGVAATKVNGT